MAETNRAWRLRAVATFGPCGAPASSFRKKIAGTKVRRSPPPARRGCSAPRPDGLAFMQERSCPLRRGHAAEKPKLRSRSGLSSNYATFRAATKSFPGQKLAFRVGRPEIFRGRTINA